MENRKSILNCALQLFYQKGYDAVGVQEIVEKAGVTKPTLYYYFGSKRGLLEKLLQEHFGKMEEKLVRASAYDAGIPEILYRLARAFFDGATADPEFYLMILSLFYSGRQSEGFQIVYPMVKRYYRIYVEVFARASEELGNMHGRQEQFAIGFSGILDHHLMHAATNRDDLSKLHISDEETRSIVKQFMYGIYS
ncbi:MAG: TetR/AcrR family transcriptional regulator [Lachnospiraceae bacterium]|nr:TetR/AcrR family transcriptional regulator [Lachnospiraceae bacterium]